MNILPIREPTIVKYFYLKIILQNEQFRAEAENAKCPFTSPFRNFVFYI